jgi:hypothetical protein
VGSLRLGLQDALAQAAVSLRIPPVTQLCSGNRSVLLGIAPLLWPLIMYALSVISSSNSRFDNYAIADLLLKLGLLPWFRRRAPPLNSSSSNVAAASRPCHRFSSNSRLSFSF